MGRECRIYFSRLLSFPTQPQNIPTLLEVIQFISSPSASRSTKKVLFIKKRRRSTNILKSTITRILTLYQNDTSHHHKLLAEPVNANVFTTHYMLSENVIIQTEILIFLKTRQNVPKLANFRITLK